MCISLNMHNMSPQNQYRAMVIITAFQICILKNIVFFKSLKTGADFRLRVLKLFNCDQHQFFFSSDDTRTKNSGCPVEESTASSLCESLENMCRRMEEPCFTKEAVCICCRGQVENML